MSTEQWWNGSDREETVRRVSYRWFVSGLMAFIMSKVPDVLLSLRRDACTKVYTSCLVRQSTGVYSTCCLLIGAAPTVILRNDRKTAKEKKC